MNYKKIGLWLVTIPFIAFFPFFVVFALFTSGQFNFSFETDILFGLFLLFSPWIALIFILTGIGFLIVGFLEKKKK